jgi:hypothetical protein
MNTKFFSQLFLLNIIMALNMVNIIFNWKKTWIPAINAIILIFILFQIIDFNQFNINRKILLLATISSCFMGPIMESIILHFTKQGSWKYGNPSFNWYVPLDLLPGYGLLGFGFIMNYFTISKLLS